MKAKRGKCLALVAVLAMVVCAFAVAMPAGESDAAGTPVADGTYNTKQTITGGKASIGDVNDDGSGGRIYTVTANTELTIAGTYISNLYVLDGVTVTIVGATAATAAGVVNIYAAESKGKCLSNDTCLTITGLQEGTVKVTVDYGSSAEGAKVSSSMAIWSESAIGNVASVKATLTTAEGQTNGAVYVPEGYTLSGPDGEFTDIFGVVKTVDSSTATFYGTAPATITLGENKSATVYNGSTTVTDGTNTVKLTDMVSVGVKFEYSSGITVTGGNAADKGAISVTAGHITVGTNNLSFPAAGIDAYANAAIANSTKLGATLFDAGVAAADSGLLTANVWIYGDKEDVEIQMPNANVINLGPGAVVKGTISVANADASAYLPVIGGTIYNTKETVITLTATKGAVPTITALAGFAFDNITISANLVLSEGLDLAIDNSITFGTDGKLTATSYDIVVLGTVDGVQGQKIDAKTVKTTPENVAYLQQYSKTTVGALDAEAVTSAAELYKAIKAGYKKIKLTLSADQVLAYNEIAGIDAKKLSAEGVAIEIESSGEDYVLYIGSEDGTNKFNLDLTKCTITTVAGNNTPSIAVSAGSSLSIDESNLYIAVDADMTATITSVNNTATYDNVSGTANVGYGATLYVSGKLSAGTETKVYGTLIVPEGKTLSVPALASITTVKGAQIMVQGTLEVAGSVSMAEGTYMTVDGSVDVSNANGAAVLKNEGSVTVNGTVSVSAPNERMPANEIQAGANGFTVNGAMIMNGKLSGTVTDKGTVAINGTSNGAEVVIYDGVSLSVASVSGTLTVSDKGIMMEKYYDWKELDYKTGVTVYDGNSIVLTDVTGMTVSEAVTDKVKNNERTVTCYMYISGTAIRSDDISAGSAVKTCIAINATSKTKVYANESVILGEAVGMSIAAGTFEVGSDAIVSAIAKNSKISSVDGTKITVNGTIMCSTVSDIKGTVNAAKYSVTDSVLAVTVNYYTTIDAALAEIEDADSKTVTQLGSVTMKEDAAIEAGQKLVVNGTLTIDADKVLTVDKGGKVTGETVTVNGAFVIENYASDVQLKYIVADVVVKEDPARTYTSLANAIALGMTEIVLNNEANISADLTIPEGTTVTSQHNIHVNQNTVLTIDGVLELTGEADIDDATVTGYDSEKDTLGKIAVNGQVSIEIDDPETYQNGLFDKVSGAGYVKESGAVITFYFSNLADAVEAMDATVLKGTITVQGTVVCDEDLVLTKPAAIDECGIVIIGTSDNKTSVSVKSITLDGSMLVSDDEYSVFNGTVYAADADGVAAIEMKKAHTFALSSETEYGVSEDTNYLYLGGTLGGQNVIAQGTVTVYTNLAVGVLSGNTTDKLTVDAGATLAVPQNAVLFAYYTGNVTTDDLSAAVVVDGTLDVTKGAVYVYGLQVNGTMNVANSQEVTRTSLTGATLTYVGVEVVGKLEINGTVDISAEDGKEGIVSVNNSVYSQVIVGQKPSTLGAEAAVTGTIVIDGDGTVKVYSGSVDKIVDAIGDLEPTAFFINGTKYFEVYSDTAMISEVIAYENIDLSGLTTPTTFAYYSDEAMKNKVTDAAIGTYGSIYMEFDASEVSGTVTVGIGLQVYIDGVRTYGTEAVDLSVGTHTVTFEVISGYDGDNVKIAFNGQTVQNGSFTITADMQDYTLTVTGATASTPVQPTVDNGMKVTDYLLIVLVVLIAIMAVMVALRLMRS